MLASGAGLLLPDDEPEGLAEAVGRLLTDTARLAQARRSARAEAARFAGPGGRPRVPVDGRSAPSRSDDRGSDEARMLPARPPWRCTLTACIARSPPARGSPTSAWWPLPWPAPERPSSPSRVAGLGRVVPPRPGRSLGRDPGEVAAVDGWSVRALAALSGPGLAPAVRDRAAGDLRPTLAGPADARPREPTRLVVLALIVLGLRTGPGAARASGRPPWPADRARPASGAGVALAGRTPSDRARRPAFRTPSSWPGSPPATPAHRAGGEGPGLVPASRRAWATPMACSPCPAASRPPPSAPRWKPSPTRTASPEPAGSAAPR